MTSTSISKYYRRAVFLPGLIVISGYIIFAIFDVIFGKQYNSEYLTNSGVWLATIAMVAVNTVFVGVLATPIFLNNQPKIRMNIAISFLTWFLCPMIWFFYLLSKHYHYLTRSHQLDIESAFVFSNTLPFILGLIFSFIKFRKEGIHTI